jgi:polysaccharide export outer membrane protein
MHFIRVIQIRKRAALAIALLGATMLVHQGWAQQSVAEQVMGASPSLSQQCNGPLGSLLPECQAGKNAINISSITSLGAPSGDAAAHTASPKTAGPERDVPPPAVTSEPPSEFQRFVASSVGGMLPIFGASLFERVPTTFAPLDRVPVTADYVIAPGDEILLRVWGQVSIDSGLTVDRAGAIFVPQAGTISVAGLQYNQLNGFLRSQLDRVFRNFDLNVNMGQLRSIQIFVMGQARRPGTYTVSSLSTLVNALFASGGPSAHGSMRHIQLKRGAQIVTELDLYDLLLNGDKSKDVRLLPGDVVFIPPVGPQMALAGSVKTPAIYEAGGRETMGDLIRMAGGLSAVADADHATLERIRERSRRESFELKLDTAGLATPAADGDVLHVQTVTPRFDNTITLRGNVAAPGRFPWHTGMRLRDILPDKESLVTRDYWKKRNLLGFTPQDEAVAAEPRAEAQRKPAQTNIEPSTEINWSYAVIERQNPKDLATELIPFHPGKLILENDATENLELRRGDVVTIFSQADIRVASTQQRRLVRLEGEFVAAGVYSVLPGETLGQLIQRAGGLTPQAYLYGAEFQRDSTRVDQQHRLDRFVQDLQVDVEHGASSQLTKISSNEDAALLTAQLQNQRALVARLAAVRATGRIVLRLEPGSKDISTLTNFALEDGDRFVVPARPATVNVLGSVYNANSFLYDPSLRISDYVRQAGGPTRNADSSRMFVIRADGSVEPRKGSGAFSHPFESGTLNPGDSVVLPEAIFKTSVLRGIRDWSQVIAQFALGAAAINVLK